MGWALGELYQLPGWQGGVSERDMQQLLGGKQLQVLAAADTVRHACNVLFALGYMATKDAPLVSITEAHQMSQQLLAAIAIPVVKWKQQDISNTMLLVGSWPSRRSVCG